MKRGEVWLVNLDPTVGAEIKKTRPAVIVNHDALGSLPLAIIVPITAWNEQFREAAWHVRVAASERSGLNKDSSADTFQVRSVSRTRLVRQLGELDEGEINRVSAGLRTSLDL